MIVRAIIDRPELAANFDHFNDYKDTLSFLEGAQATDPERATTAIARLKEAHERFLAESQRRQEQNLAMYLDWSDYGMDKYESGQSGVYADLSHWVEDDGNLFLNLRRNTKKKCDFTLILSRHQAEELYKQLKEQFEP